jgi:hypothetical protein
MPKTKISEFDVDPANNTDINSINIAEGCAPSGINNAIRQLMSDLKEFQTGAGGDPFNGAVNGTVGATTPAAGAFTTLSATGVATVSAGTVSAPAITTSGDTNTGIFFPAADTIAFTEGGTESMRIDSSGNVGIGTASPTNFGSAFKMLAVQGSDFGVIQAISNSGSTTLEMMGSSGIGYVGTRTNHPVAFRTNDTERMRIDSSGNVGIGRTSPAYKLDVNGISQVSGLRQSFQTGLYEVDGALSNYSSTNGVYLNGNAAGWLSLRGDGTGTNRIQLNGASYGEANIQTFFTSNTERMRIDSSGNVIFKGGSADTSLLTTGSGATRYWTQNKASSEGSGFTYHIFQNAGTSIGSISFNGSGISYNTTSDYRLKENIAPMTGALATVSALKPVTYKWKSDGSDGQGFIAHELQEVVPDCVTGEKDAVDAEGNPVYQGIDTSFLVATLTAAIQELKSEVDALKAQLNQ